MRKKALIKGQSAISKKEEEKAKAKEQHLKDLQEVKNKQDSLWDEV